MPSQAADGVGDCGSAGQGREQRSADPEQEAVGGQERQEPPGRLVQRRGDDEEDEGRIGADPKRAAEARMPALGIRDSDLDRGPRHGKGQRAPDHRVAPLARAQQQQDGGNQGQECQKIEEHVRRDWWSPPLAGKTRLGKPRPAALPSRPMNPCPTVALLVAAGRGQRFGAALPKQYLPLAGKPVLRHSVEAFARHPSVDAVRVVIHGDDRQRYEAALSGLTLLPPVEGGATRQESVRRGLESLSRPRLRARAHP